MKALQYCARWHPGLQNSIRSAPAPAQAPRLLQNNIPSSTERKRQQRLAAAVAREVRVRAGGRHGRGAAQVPGRGRAQQEETAAANIGLERNYVSCWPPHKNCSLRYLDIDR